MSELAEKLDALIDEAKDGGIVARLPAADLIALAAVARDAAAYTGARNAFNGGDRNQDLRGHYITLEISLAALAKEIDNG